MMQIESQLSHLRLHGMSRSWQALTETRRQHELTLSEGLEVSTPSCPCSSVGLADIILHQKEYEQERTDVCVG